MEHVGFDLLDVRAYKYTIQGVGMTLGLLDVRAFINTRYNELMTLGWHAMRAAWCDDLQHGAKKAEVLGQGLGS